jgi:hypothetical protein
LVTGFSRADDGSTSAFGSEIQQLSGLFCINCKQVLAFSGNVSIHLHYEQFESIRRVKNSRPLHKRRRYRDRFVVAPIEGRGE